MNGVNTNDAVCGLVLFLFFIFFIIIGVVAPSWWMSIIIALFGIVNGAYLIDMNFKYGVRIC